MHDISQACLDDITIISKQDLQNFAQEDRPQTCLVNLELATWSQKQESFTEHWSLNPHWTSVLTCQHQFLLAVVSLMKCISSWSDTQAHSGFLIQLSLASKHIQVSWEDSISDLYMMLIGLTFTKTDQYYWNQAKILLLKIAHMMQLISSNCIIILMLNSLIRA